MPREALAAVLEHLAQLNERLHLTTDEALDHSRTVAIDEASQRWSVSRNRRKTTTCKPTTRVVSTVTNCALIKPLAGTHQVAIQTIPIATSRSTSMHAINPHRTMS
jgi:hypothetical protein